MVNNNATGNTAHGYQALFNHTTGNDNVAVGALALVNNTIGGGNIALGTSAGANIAGDENIDIGNTGNAADSHTIRIGDNQTRAFIAGIRGVTTGNNNAMPVLIDSQGQLGTMTSSRRFKHEVKPMGNASEAIHPLKPVTFHHKSDDTKRPEFGLIAEEVAKVNQDLVVRDANGEIYTVRYDAVNAMLLIEFLKEHHRVEEQQAAVAKLRSLVSQQRKEFQAAIADQRNQFEERLKQQDARIQKLSAQLELDVLSAQTASNNK
jgi:hypothetical protein